MMCLGDYERKPPICEKFIEKKKCICTNGRLENGLKYLNQAFYFNVINASTTYKNIKNEKNGPLICIQVIDTPQ